MGRLFVLDAMGLAYRAYYAFIRRPLINSRGENTSAIFGFANTALKIRREEKPEFWALAWDGPGPTFRHLRYADYKATRKPMPEDLLSQIPAIEDLAAALGLPVLEIPGFEADDVMATLASRAELEGHEVVLVTSDKDLLQLVTDRVQLLSPAARGEEYLRVDRDAVHQKWGVAPEQIRDVLALMGDASDNVPGVPGVGEKTAVELIQQFGTLDAIYARLEEVKRDSLRAKLVAHREQAYLSRELVTVRTDLELPWTLEQLRVGSIRRDALLELAQRYELARLDRIATESGVADHEAGVRAPARSAERRGTAAETAAEGVKLAGPAPRGLAQMPSAQATLDLWGSATGSAPLDQSVLATRVHAVRARALHGLALYAVAGGEDARVAPLVGLGLAARDGTACYLPLAHAAGPNFRIEQVREWLSGALSDPTVPKVAEDLKSCAHLLAGAGLPFSGLEFDVHLGSFLCDPERGHTLDELAREWLGRALPPLEPAAVRGRPRAGMVTLEVAETAAAAEAAAAVLFPLYDAMRAQLEAREQWPLYRELEHPLIPVLLDMERAGVLIDRAVLAEMSAHAGVEIARLERELGELAGEPINLNSGPQLAKLLFEKLALKPGRKTKSGGFSTDSEVLEELAAQHPFPARLLEYRALSKLRSTYLESLAEVADRADGRVHTTFNQAGAATGRLSSSNPNLQNIPIRTAQGRAIRRAFVAPQGGVLVGADYSQIELRVMAHLSGDPNLIEAFRSGEDVHASTARRIFGIGAEVLLDSELRARAKVVNFGVMYGMGARSLAQQMGISLKEAQDFIAHYFGVYARVREFLDRTLEEARQRGFVQTLLGRRRYLPELNGADGMRRSMAERAAINTPIQGSAADLMKLAMIRVHRALKRFGGSARLLLQVHDELLIECRAAEVEGVSNTVRAEMEGCFPLRVPLQVTLGRGATWFDVH